MCKVNNIKIYIGTLCRSKNYLIMTCIYDITIYIHIIIIYAQLQIHN